ncbi:aromatic aminobenezylarsenical efflux permease ArsG family transporter [Lentisphaerota bacterium WC36G]|nr:aromatic aminobenezylarsenical efflux permease ArsG family transporter [Lentisphaerae bacterium WC36]
MISLINIIIVVISMGILTAISPCPLATNIAAISYISQNNSSHKTTLLASILYSTGRTLTYLLLSLIITFGMLKSATLSRFLQEHMNEFLGPVLIFIGLVLLKLIQLNLQLKFKGHKLQEYAKNGNIAAAFLIGVIFTLSFCPVSATIFFGGLIPMILKEVQAAENPQFFTQYLLPVIYGISSSLPVILFALLIVFVTKKVDKFFDKVVAFEKYFRMISGIIFIMVGLYYCLNYNLELL